MEEERFDIPVSYRDFNADHLDERRETALRLGRRARWFDLGTLRSQVERVP